MSDPPTFRPARLGDCAALTALARRAKAHWGYPQEWLELWADDLAFTPQRLGAWEVICAEVDGQIAAVGALSLEPGEAEVEGLWVDPDHMGRGLGRALMDRLSAAARQAGAPTLTIAADPQALGFYERLGARQVGWEPSAPAGRRLPLLHLDLQRGARP